jgi:hypothetical protein
MEKQQENEVITPIMIADQALQNPEEGVIPTRPAIAPEQKAIPDIFLVRA